jgi:hypothetical protein
MVKRSVFSSVLPPINVLCFISCDVFETRSILLHVFYYIIREFIFLNPRNFKYCVTYFLTPWSRVLLEKLTGLQPVKKFPVFYGTRRFITSFTSARHLSVS